jgi:hypothetical protein
MNVNLVTRDNKDILEGPQGSPLLRTEDDTVDLIGACFEHRTRAVLLYAENLTERFFDLSSGEAGAILQKLQNYGIRLALIIPAGSTPQSTRFGELVSEERRGNAFRVFEDTGSAENWLSQD